MNESKKAENSNGEKELSQRLQLNGEAHHGLYLGQVYQQETGTYMTQDMSLTAE